MVRAAKDGKNTLSIQSQRLYLRCLFDILEAGRVRNFMPNNPAMGVKPLQKPKETDAEKRMPWDMDQVKGFFQGKFYNQCASAQPVHQKGQGVAVLDAPLDALFGGTSE